ncbi:acyl CoA binding protein-domain-containing protein [Aspergillus ambiguus]|uniref:acyl CoA binding protein-domain-containing protein n=1 Tax=Aspergillus ambiguus TaxID=176160 RepID=UPI003CCD5B1A
MDEFYTALSASQNKAQYTPEVQKAAQGINDDLLKTAVQIVLAGDDSASVEGDQAAALKAGFEYAIQLVKMLEQEPNNDEKLDLYKYFKRGHDQTPAKPGMFALEAKYKYSAWEKISHISTQKAQALYIQQVDTLIKKYGTRA